MTKQVFGQSMVDGLSQPSASESRWEHKEHIEILCCNCIHEDIRSKVRKDAQKERDEKLVERIEGFKKIEQDAKPADEQEKLYEWAYLKACDEIITLIKNS